MEDDFNDNPFADSAPTFSSPKAQSFQPYEQKEQYAEEPLNSVSLDEPVQTEVNLHADHEVQENKPISNQSTESFTISDDISVKQTTTGFKLIIEDPKKVTESFSSFVQYKVVFEGELEGYKKHSAVYRRYKDFDWLYHQLRQANPGVFVPPIPEKQAMGRYEEDFIECRRFGLEVFMQSCISHPRLVHDKTLISFLQQEHLERSGKGLLNEIEGGFLKLFSFTQKTSVPNDDYFDEKRAAILDLDATLKGIQTTVDLICSQRSDLADSTRKFSQHLTALAQVEEEANVHDCLTYMGEVHQKIADIYDVQASNEIFYIAYKVEEYLRLIQSIKKTLEAREKAFGAHEQAQTQLLKKREALQKSKLIGGKNEKTDQYQREVQIADEKVKSTAKIFEESTKVIKSEFERFDASKVQHFKDSLISYMQRLVLTHEKIFNVWNESNPEKYLVSES